MSVEKKRYTITVDEALLRKIEDYRFENRFQTRAAASEALIRIGLVETSKKDDVSKNLFIPHKESK